MIFNSFEFLCWFPPFFLLYYGLKQLYERQWSEVANVLLLAVSYYLYFRAAAGMTIVLLWVTAVTYLGAIAMEHPRMHNRRKNALWIFGVMGVGALAVYKYSAFFVSNLQAVFSWIGSGFAISPINIIAPLGISFFTFQAIGYMFDVYRRKEKAERNWWHYMLFVSFFPQIASGPIGRAGQLLPQIKSERRADAFQIVEGMKALLWGYFLKAVFADRVAIMADTILNNYQHYSGPVCFVGSLMYSMQIYGDFAGYSLMAVGVGKMLGFELTVNFNRPYFSTSINEFWRRWHISLSTWLRDYVYIPLGGNRKGKLRSYMNVMTTFLISGIWHGANWTFIAWGGIHGGVQMIEKATGWNKREKKGWLKIGAIALTFLVANFAWIFFRMPTIGDACKVIGRIFTNAPGSYSFTPEKSQLAMATFAIIVVFISELVAEKHLGNGLYGHKFRWVRWSAYVATLLAILLFGVLDAGQFIYVSF